MFILHLILVAVGYFFFVQEDTLLQNSQVIIVLGNPSRADGSISPVQKSRMDVGLSLYQNDFAQKLLFTGGAAWNGHIESETMKKYAIKSGVTEEAILIETKSSNTGENVAFSYEILKSNQLNKIIVVTNRLHTRRAKFLFANYPLDVQVVAADYPNFYNWFYLYVAILNEYYGFGRYFLIGE